MIETIKYGVITWSHITKPTDDDFKTLMNTYHFHPLDIEDCKSVKNLRPKVDVYDDYRFMNFHFPIFDKTNTFVEVKELKVFWGERFLITIGRSHWLVKELFDAESKEKKMEIGSSDILLYNILDKLTKVTQDMVEKIESNVNECGHMLFDKKAEKTIQKISVTRKNVISLNTLFKPQLMLFTKMQNGSIEGFAPNMEDYWGNLLDYYQKIWDTVEDAGELIRGYSTTFDSLQVNKTNEVMKILTLISSILLPITFVASLYGMNIKLPFQEHQFSFEIVAGGMIAIVLGMIYYFKFRKWM